MPTFKKCGQEIKHLVNRAMKNWHKQLEEFEVTVDCLFAFATTDANGDTTGCALKKNGLPAAALIRVTPLKDRTKGNGDAEMQIDGDEWENYSDKQKLALIDHELEHLQLLFDKDGGLKRDDLDRPKLRLRPHDREVGWFDDVVKRHGRDAFEYSSFNSIWQSTRQMKLPFLDEIG